MGPYQTLWPATCGFLMTECVHITHYGLKFGNLCITKWVHIDYYWLKSGNPFVTKTRPYQTWKAGTWEPSDHQIGSCPKVWAETWEPFYDQPLIAQWSGTSGEMYQRLYIVQRSSNRSQIILVIKPGQPPVSPWLNRLAGWLAGWLSSCWPAGWMVGLLAG